MNPITHLLASWTVADVARLDRRHRALITVAGIAPDLDGAGLLVDLAQYALGQADDFGWYGRFHHELLHGLPGAITIAVAAAFLAKRRRVTFLLALAVVHLHLLCDFVGSRGPDPMDVWPIPYLAPLSTRLEFEWGGQWPLTAWPNVALTIALLAYAFYRATRSGYSPVGLISARADAVFVATVRARWAKLRGRVATPAS